MLCRSLLRIRLLSALSTLVVTGALAAAAVAADYTVDPVHATALFKVRHLGVSNTYGRFNEIAGTIAYDPADLAQSGLEVTVQAASIDTANADRDKHLKSPDFLNVKQFPTIHFKSTKVEKSGEEYAVTGDLTLHGETKTITVKVVLIGQGKGMKGEDRIGAETTFTVKRSDFGMKNMVGPIGDEITLTISIEAVKN